MSCSRSEEIDLLAFAVDRRADEWADFRDHYPRCAACSRAVAELSVLESRLATDRSASGEGGHVSEEAMLAYDDGTLEASARRALERHVAACASCRTELAVLTRFDWSALEAPAEGAEVIPIGSRFRGAVESLFPVPAVVLAAAAAVALVLWVSLADEERREETPALVEHPANDSPSPEPSLHETSESTPRDHERLAVPEAPSASGDPAPDEAAIELAEDATPTPDEPSVAPDAHSPPTRVPEDTAPEVILLAAHFPDRAPVYQLPDALVGMSSRHQRLDDTTRGAGAGDARVQVLAPDRLGFTASPSPSLHWRLSAPAAGDVELVIQDPDADEPLWKRTLRGPVDAGVRAIDLEHEGVRLDPAIEYEWSAALVVDASRRELDRTSSGAIAVRPAGAVDEASAPVWAARAHRLAADGYWYDAYAQVATWLAATPSDVRLVRYRRALLEQVGLGDSADALEADTHAP